MQIPRITAENPLRQAYRTTFDEYACKLEALQRLIDCNNNENNIQIEAAILEAEAARRAHNSARDLLAAALVANAPLKIAAARKPVADEPAGDDRVRQTAQLLWEFAGRPQGSAERDWSRAEQLVLAASNCR